MGEPVAEAVPLPEAVHDAAVTVAVADRENKLRVGELVPVDELEAVAVPAKRRARGAAGGGGASAGERPRGASARGSSAGCKAKGGPCRPKTHTAQRRAKERARMAVITTWCGLRRDSRP